MVATIHKHEVSLLPGCRLLAERSFEIALARIYDNQVLHVYFFSGGHIEMEFIEEVYDFVNEISAKPYYRNLFEFESQVDLDPEVRTWASAPTGNKNTIADALVINNLAHKLLANFYLKFNKPVKPTRVFQQREKALNWLLHQD